MHRRLTAALAWAVLALSLLPAPARAQGRRHDDDEDHPRAPFFKVSAGPWATSGMGRWQTSFPLCQNLPKSECGFGSTLEYMDRSDDLYFISAEIRPHPRISFEAEYADSEHVTGTERDHDWIDAPNGIITAEPSGNVYVQPHQQDMSLSRASMSGRTTYMAANVYGRVLIKEFRGDDPVKYEWIDVSLGYMRYDDRFRMKDLVQLIATQDFIQTPAPGPVAGLDETFHFNWSAPTVGFREETGFLRYLSATGAFVFSPIVQYYGEGFWNLRTDFRKGAPSFTEHATGTLFQGNLSLNIKPLPFLSLETGYMIVYLHSRGGRLNSFLADGSAPSQDLDSAWSERKGWTFKAALQF